MDGLVIHELLFMCKSIMKQVRIGMWTIFRYSLLNERSIGHSTGCSYLFNREGFADRGRGMRELMVL
jgi:hypothetical protein